MLLDATFLIGSSLIWCTLKLALGGGGLAGMGGGGCQGGSDKETQWL